MVEDALSFWTEIQRYEDMLAADSKSLCFAPLSELYRKLGLLEDAVSVAEKGCAAHPEYHLGFVALGNACYAKGMASEARRALERAVSLQPDHIQALKLLSQIYVELGEISLARQTLGHLLSRDPDDLESKMLLDSIASAPGSDIPGAASPPPQEEELLEDLEIIEELDEVLEEPAAPAAPRPAPAVAPATVEQESDDIWAIEDLEEVAESAAVPPAPRSAAPDPLTTATLAELYVSQGFLDKAIGIYRELLSAHPQNQQYRLRVEELVEQKELQHAPVETQAASAPVEPAAPAAAAAAPAISAVSVTPDSADIFDLDDGAAVAEVPVTAVAAASAFTFGAMESPAEQEAAPLEQPLAAEASSDEDLESSLQRWLENIRRRKDGV